MGESDDPNNSHRSWSTLSSRNHPLDCAAVALCTQPQALSEPRGQQGIRSVTRCFPIQHCSVFNNPYPCLCPTFRLESFWFLPSSWQDEVFFFFLNISFNKICTEYAHLCQWSGKCALSSREHAHCRFPLSFRNYFWSWWFYFVSPADTNQMTEMIWGWILSRRERRRKSERKLW